MFIFSTKCALGVAITEGLLSIKHCYIRYPTYLREGLLIILAYILRTLLIHNIGIQAFQ